MTLLDEVIGHPVYLDGSGSTQFFWASAAGAKLLAILKGEVYWVGMNNVVRAQVFRAEFAGSPNFVAMNNHRKDKHPFSVGYFLTDEGQEAEQLLDAAAGRSGKKNFRIVTFKQLENELRTCSCSYHCTCLTSVSERVHTLEYDFERLQDMDEVQKRNRIGIELHSKLEKTVNELDQLNGDDPEVQDLQIRVRALTDRLMVKIFRIRPESMKRVRDEKAEAEQVASRSSHESPAANKVGVGDIVEMRVKVADTYVNDDVSGVEVELALGNETLRFTGSAKRNPIDKPNRETAILVATAKAMRKVSTHVQRLAQDHLDANDKIRKAAIAEKAARVTEARKQQRAARERKTVAEYRAVVEDLNAQLAKAQKAAARRATPRKAAPRKTAAVKKATPKK